MKDKTFIFGLYDSNGQQIDTTGIDDNDPEHAMALFKEYSFTNQEYQVRGDWYVLLEDTEEE